MTPESLLSLIEGSLESQLVGAREALLEASASRDDGPLRLVATFSDHIVVVNGLGAVLRLEWNRKTGLTEGRTLGTLDLKPKESMLDLIEQALDKLNERLSHVVAENQYAIRVDCASKMAFVEAWYTPRRTISEVQQRLITLQAESSCLSGKLAPASRALLDAMLYLRGLHIESRKASIPDRLLGKAREAVRSIETIICFAKSSHRETT